VLRGAFPADSCAASVLPAVQHKHICYGCWVRHTINLAAAAGAAARRSSTTLLLKCSTARAWCPARHAVGPSGNSPAANLQVASHLKAWCPASYQKPWRPARHAVGPSGNSPLAQLELAAPKSVAAAIALTSKRLP
jgi:hypothetical protein